MKLIHIFLFGQRKGKTSLTPALAKKITWKNSLATFTLLYKKGQKVNYFFPDCETKTFVWIPDFNLSAFTKRYDFKS